MNICFVEDTLLRGGTQIWALETMKVFKNKGHNVSLICPKKSWMTKEWDNVTTYDYNNPKEKDILKGVSKANILITTVHPARDKFHICEFLGNIIKKNKLKTKLLPKCSTIVPEYKKTFYFQGNNYIIAGTKKSKKELIRLFNIPKEKIKVIYQGTDVKRFVESKQNKKMAKKKYLNTNKKVFGCFGTFQTRKGHTYLVKAFAKVLEKRKDIHLLLVGKGKEKRSITKEVKDLGISNNASIFPFTNKPQIPYEVVDVLVVSSTEKESLPNVILESMCMGKNVVSTKLGAISEVITSKTGYIVKPTDVDSLSKAMLKSISNKKRYESMGKASKELMQKNFDKDNQYDKYLRFFESII